MYDFFRSDSAGLKAEGFQSEALAEKKIIYIPAISRNLSAAGWFLQIKIYHNVKPKSIRVRGSHHNERSNFRFRYSNTSLNQNLKLC